MILKQLMHLNMLLGVFGNDQVVFDRLMEL